MAGRPGRSGGHNRLTEEEHRLRGTWYRKPPKTAHATPSHVAPPEPHVPPERLTAGLGPAGADFFTRTWSAYTTWADWELTLLRQASRTLDDAETATSPKFRQSAIRLFGSLLQQLELELPKPTPASPPASKWNDVGRVILK